MASAFVSGAEAICPQGPAGGHRDYGAAPCHSCRATAEAVLVAAWHDLDQGLAAAMPMHEWLGMSWHNYKAWAEGRP
jgi:hypothetical protein